MRFATAEDLLAELIDIQNRIDSCFDCALSKSRTNTVPGQGSSTAKIMFVGEGPGFNEDQSGKPFVGAAGQFLDDLLSSIELSREDVFITNLVKCRPPNNRDPYPKEIDSCSNFLDAQIEAIKPLVIVPLGRHALSRWFPGETIGKVRAKERFFDGTYVMPLYHPAAGLHNGGLRSTIYDDFQKLKTFIESLGGDDQINETKSAVTTSSNHTTTDGGEQLNLF